MHQLARSTLILAILARYIAILKIENTMTMLDQTFIQKLGVLAALEKHAIVSVANKDGIIVYVNHLFCEISGYSQYELLGQNHSLLKSGIHPPAFYEHMWKTISSRTVWHGLIANKTKAGDIYWVKATIVPIVDSDGIIQSYASVRTDVTDLMNRSHPYNPAKQQNPD